MLGRADDAEVSLLDTVDIERIYDRTAFNGDGIIPADAAEDETTHAAIAAIAACGDHRLRARSQRQARHLSLSPTASSPRPPRMSPGAPRPRHRRRRSCRSASLPKSVPRPVLEIGVKLDDFFTRWRLAAFNGNAAAARNRLHALCEALAMQSLAPDRPEIRALSIAHGAAEGILPLDHGVIPAWAGAPQRLLGEGPSPRPSPPATRTISWSGATASSMTARAATGTRPSSRSRSIPSACARPSGCRTISSGASPASKYRRCLRHAPPARRCRRPGPPSRPLPARRRRRRPPPSNSSKLSTPHTWPAFSPPTASPSAPSARAIASVVTLFMHLSWWQMPLAVGGITLMISGPSMVIAALKLRHRDLGPILEACGWAVNARLAINLPFGTALTARARLPERAERSLNDPYAEKRQPWGVHIAIAAIAAALAGAWQLGVFDRWLRG